MRHTDLGREVSAIECRNQAQAGQGLHAVADANDETTGIHVTAKNVAEMSLHAVRKDSACAEMVPEGKSTDKRQNVVIEKLVGRLHEIAEMHTDNFSATGLEGRGGLNFAVQTITSNNEGADAHNWVPRRRGKSAYHSAKIATRKPDSAMHGFGYGFAVYAGLTPIPKFEDIHAQLTHACLAYGGFRRSCR